jgi:formylglycine-generating enzyme required for sulfatase activity
MHSNVWEWVEDAWHDNYKKAPEDGSAWLDNSPGTLRVFRGGSWINRNRFCRAAYSCRCDPGYRDELQGFRLVHLPG